MPSLPRNSPVIAFILAAFGATSGPAPAQTTSTAPKPEAITAIIQKVDDSTTAVGMTGIEDGQLLVLLHPQPGTDEPAKIPLIDVSEVVLKKAGTYSISAGPASRPANNLTSCRLLLADNDRLSGDIVSWSDKHLVIRPNIATSVSLDLPVSRLSQLWCGTADQIKKAQTLKAEAGLEDIAFAVKDDDVIAVHGIVLGIDADSLHFRFENADRKISLARLVGLVMAKSDEVAAEDSFYQSVQFVTDEQISGMVAGIDGRELLMQTRGGQNLRLPLAQVAKIQSRNGRLVYLSDLKPVRVEQTPYFDRLLKYQLDKSLNGRPITLQDGTYSKGISVHSRCVLTFKLDGKYDEFRTKAGFQLPEGKVGQAIIRVKGDDKTLFENLDARGDQAPADLKLNVTGIQDLTLEVDYGKNDDVGDRVVWANARLIRPGRP